VGLWNRSLYEIDAELELIVAQLESEDFTDDQKRSALDFWFEANQDEIESKIDGYCAVIADKEGWAELRKAEAKKIADMAKADEKTVSTLKDRVKSFFGKAGIKKMSTPHFAPCVRMNGGKLPLLIDDEILADPYKLAPEYCKPVPDTDAIRKALEEGKEVPGCKIGERDSHFRLR